MVKKRSGRKRSISKSFISMFKTRGKATPRISFGILIFTILLLFLDKLTYHFSIALFNMMDAELALDENKFLCFTQKERIFKPSVQRGRLRCCSPTVL